jgi:hypothetical protein
VAAFWRLNPPHPPSSGSPRDRPRSLASPSTRVSRRPSGFTAGSSSRWSSRAPGCSSPRTRPSDQRRGTRSAMTATRPGIPLRQAVPRRSAPDRRYRRAAIPRQAPIPGQPRPSEASSRHEEPCVRPAQALQRDVESGYSC